MNTVRAESLARSKVDTFHANLNELNNSKKGALTA